MLRRHFAIEGESDSEGEGSEDGCSLPVVAEALAGDLMAQLPAHTGHEPPVLGEALGAPSQAFEAEVAEMSEADQERVRGSSQVTGPISSFAWPLLGQDQAAHNCLPTSLGNCSYP